MDKVELLIRVLLDKNARIDERDDAAMDLGKYDDDRALNALISIVLNPNEDSFIMDVCGESIGEIWVKRNFFDFDLYKKMHKSAQNELINHIKSRNPEIIRGYNISK